MRSCLKTSSQLAPRSGLVGSAFGSEGLVAPVHLLDRRADRFAVTAETLARAAQTVGIRRRRTDLDRRTLSVEQEEVETLA
jgi:hypothetical protein